MEPPKFVSCDGCSCLGYMQRVYTAPRSFTHQTGAEWLNEVATGYGDPPAGMSREKGMAVARAKAAFDKKQHGQKPAARKMISAGSSPMKEYMVD